LTLLIQPVMEIINTSLTNIHTSFRTLNMAWYYLCNIFDKKSIYLNRKNY